MPNTHKLVFATDEYLVEEVNVNDGEKYVILPSGKILTTTGDVVGFRSVSMSRRKAEMDMLLALAETAANSQKAIKDANVCLDILGQLEGLTGKEPELGLSKNDIKFLADAFEAMAGRRPGGWIKYCRSMISQLAEPKEI